MDEPQRNAHRAAMTADHPEIPYGRADFKGIRLDGALYVDKTGFLAPLERWRYVVFIRPRRFGKTCWLSTLQSYYDRTERASFATVFGDTEVAAAPTPNRNRYMMLRFDFSGLDAPVDALPALFEECCDIELRRALRTNAELFAGEATRAILSHSSVNAKLRELFAVVGEKGIPLYVLVDEYDNVANAVLARHGEEAYYSLTRNEGFFRAFFANLKVGTNTGAVERMFVTGVSPVALDDLTSGFNIGWNLSQHGEFNNMLGFTEDEVRGVLERYQAAGALLERPPDALAAMREWYNGYRFGPDAQDDVYNPNMVLYYLAASVPNRAPPRDLIDDNVRVDYGKLRHLLTSTPARSPRVLNGNFDLLRSALAEGGATCRVRSSFPLQELGDRDNFFSLLHYLGLLSIRAADRSDQPQLAVPNQTAHHLLRAFLRDAYRDMGAFAVDLTRLEALMRNMARSGEWRPVLAFLAEAIRSQTSVRDYLREEKMVQGFLAAYLGVTDHFLLFTERELRQGFVDFCLEPFTARHRAARHGYLIELKYVKRDAPDEQLEVALNEAAAQLRRYLADARLRRQFPQISYTGLALVFHGWELARSEPVAAADGA